MMNGAYSPWSSCMPWWGWNQWVPGSGTTKSNAKVPPGGVSGVVTPGTPSMSLRIARPCQWTLVASGRSLWKSTMTRSPAVARNGVPGTESPNPHVCTTVPLRSSAIGCARSVRRRVPADALGTVEAGRVEAMASRDSGTLHAPTPRAAPATTTRTRTVDVSGPLRCPSVARLPRIEDAPGSITRGGRSHEGSMKNRTRARARTP